MGILLSADDVMLSKGELEGLDEIAVLEKTARENMIGLLIP